MADYYKVLDLDKTATEQDVRYSFRHLALQKHPDKGGSEIEFAEIQEAYEILVNTHKRKIYDRYGVKGLERSVEMLFAEKFRGGAFGYDKQKMDTLRTENERLLKEMQLLKPGHENSYASSFDAWLRNRSDDQGVVLTSKDIAEKYGVDESSYEKVNLTLPLNHNSIQSKDGKVPKTVIEKAPTELEWGTVVVRVLASPVTDADNHSTTPGFLGLHGVGIVEEIGPGVTDLKKDDMVMPCVPGVGMWREYVVERARKFIPFPITGLDIKQLGLFSQFCTAYMILHDCDDLKPGDTVVLNAPETPVGQAIIQLCKILHLKSIALLDDDEKYDEFADNLTRIGATHVWKNRDDIATRIARVHLGEPRLGIDGLGELTRIAGCMRVGSTLVTHSKKSPKQISNILIDRDITLRGFDLFQHIGNNGENIRTMMEILVLLMEDSKLTASVMCVESLEELRTELTNINNKGCAMWVNKHASTK